MLQINKLAKPWYDWIKSTADTNKLQSEVQEELDKYQNDFGYYPSTGEKIECQIYAHRHFFQDKTRSVLKGNIENQQKFALAREINRGINSDALSRAELQGIRIAIDEHAHNKRSARHISLYLLQLDITRIINLFPKHRTYIREHASMLFAQIQGALPVGDPRHRLSSLFSHLNNENDDYVRVLNDTYLHLTAPPAPPVDDEGTPLRTFSTPSSFPSYSRDRNEAFKKELEEIKKLLCPEETWIASTSDYFQALPSKHLPAVREYYRPQLDAPKVQHPVVEAYDRIIDSIDQHINHLRQQGGDQDGRPAWTTPLDSLKRAREQLGPDPELAIKQAIQVSQRRLQMKLAGLPETDPTDTLDPIGHNVLRQFDQVWTETFGSTQEIVPAEVASNHGINKHYYYSENDIIQLLDLIEEKYGSDKARIKTLAPLTPDDFQTHTEAALQPVDAWDLLIAPIGSVHHWTATIVARKADQFFAFALDSLSKSCRVPDYIKNALRKRDLHCAVVHHGTQSDGSSCGPLMVQDVESIVQLWSTGLLTSPVDLPKCQDIVALRQVQAQQISEKNPNFFTFQKWNMHWLGSTANFQQARNRDHLEARIRAILENFSEEQLDALRRNPIPEQLTNSQPVIRALKNSNMRLSDRIAAFDTEKKIKSSIDGMSREQQQTFIRVYQKNISSKDPEDTEIAKALRMAVKECQHADLLASLFQDASDPENSGWKGDFHATCDVLLKWVNKNSPSGSFMLPAMRKLDFSSLWGVGQGHLQYDYSHRFF